MPPARPLILFYNGFWRERVPGGLPRDCPFAEFSADAARHAEADAVVFHLPSLRPPADLPKYPGQIWVAWSMESETAYPRLADARLRDVFDMEMSYRRSAEVWTPYEPFDPARLLAPAAERESAPAVLLMSSPFDLSGRTRLAAALMRRVKIHSYGTLLNNRRFADGPADEPGARGEAKRALCARYKFTLAFENARSPDYVTEKFWDSLSAGSVPVYLGAPNIEEFAPGDGCFIDAARFGNPDELAALLNRASESEEAYAAYHAWRTRPLKPSFLRLREILAIPAFERLARAVFERFDPAARAAKTTPRRPFAPA